MKEYHLNISEYGGLKHFSNGPNDIFSGFGMNCDGLINMTICESPTPLKKMGVVESLNPKCQGKGPPSEPPSPTIKVPCQLL